MSKYGKANLRIIPVRMGDKWHAGKNENQVINSKRVKKDAMFQIIFQLEKYGQYEIQNEPSSGSSYLKRQVCLKLFFDDTQSI